MKFISEYPRPAYPEPKNPAVEAEHAEDNALALELGTNAELFSDFHQIFFHKSLDFFIISRFSFLSRVFKALK